MKDEISGSLSELMNDIIRTKEIQNTWKEANITVLPKDGTDLKDPKNYGPVSSLNTDYTIFAKILLDKLKVFLKDFIKEDQAGFLPGRQIRDNLRVLLDCVEYYDKKIGGKGSFPFPGCRKSIQ